MSPWHDAVSRESEENRPPDTAEYPAIAAPFETSPLELLSPIELPIKVDLANEPDLTKAEETPNEEDFLTYYSAHDQPAPQKTYYLRELEADVDINGEELHD